MFIWMQPRVENVHLFLTSSEFLCRMRVSTFETQHIEEVLTYGLLSAAWLFSSALLSHIAPFLLFCISFLISFTWSSLRHALSPRFWSRPVSYVCLWTVAFHFCLLFFYMRWALLRCLIGSLSSLPVCLCLSLHAHFWRTCTSTSTSTSVALTQSSPASLQRFTSPLSWISATHGSWHEERDGGHPIQHRRWVDVFPLIQLLSVSAGHPAVKDDIQKTTLGGFFIHLA